MKQDNLLANNYEIPPLLSIDLCKLAIRNENMEILEYLLLLHSKELKTFSS